MKTNFELWSSGESDFFIARGNDRASGFHLPLRLDKYKLALKD